MASSTKKAAKPAPKKTTAKPAAKPAPKKAAPKPAPKKAALAAAKPPAAAKAAKKAGVGAAAAAMAIQPVGSAALAAAQPRAERPSGRDPIETALPIGSIVRSPFNPRTIFDDDEDASLAQNIKKLGLLQPIVVRPNTSDRLVENCATWLTPAQRDSRELFEIVAGERRYRAISLLVRDGAWPEARPVPLRIVDIDDTEMLMMALSENMKRQNMHPLDEGNAFTTLRSKGLVDRQIAEELQISIRTVRRRTQLLNLCDEAAELFRIGKIDHQQASALAIGTHDAQRFVIKGGLNGGRIGDAVAIRGEMAHLVIPVGAALFPVEMYHGRIIEGEDEAERYFADPAEFRELQHAALESKLGELTGAGWAFAETTTEGWRYRRGVAKADGAGAIILCSADLRRVEVITGVARQQATPAPARPNPGGTLALAGGEDESGESDLGDGETDDDPRTRDPQEIALDAVTEQLRELVRADRHLSLAAALADFISATGIEADQLPPALEARKAGFAAIFEQGHAARDLPLILELRTWSDEELLTLLCDQAIGTLRVTMPWGKGERRIDAADAEALFSLGIDVPPEIAPLPIGSADAPLPQERTLRNDGQLDLEDAGAGAGER